MALHLRALDPLKNQPGLGGLAGAVALLGFATSFVQPYMSLFGVRHIGMAPLALGVYLTVVAVSSIAISTALARWSDRRAHDRQASRRPVVVVALVAATLGYLGLSLTTNYWAVLGIAALGLGTGSAAFPQVFALARAQAGVQAVSVLRSLFSLAWVVGPGLGAVLLATGGFPGLLRWTALCLALALVVVLWLRDRAPTVASAAEASLAEPAGLVTASKTPTRPASLVAASFVLYGTAMQMGSAALPIYVTQRLHGSEAQVGWLVGLCALLEIPVMLGLALRPARLGSEKLVLWGFALYTLYCALVLLSPGVAWLAAAQAVRAVVIGIVATLGMAYVQELMPGRVGVATTLYANTMNAGALLGGLGLGGVAQVLGYRSVFGLAALLGAAAWALLLATRRGLGTRPGG